MYKNGFRIECGMTDIGLIQFGGRSLDFAAIPAKAGTAASLGMTMVMRQKSRLAEKRIMYPRHKAGGFWNGIVLIAAPER
jgi:hypothetical protein